jgi:transcriptional regulator with XRE-family HTH domain
MKNNPIRAFRERNGLTQEALARKLGVSSVSLSRWETGNRKVEPSRLPKVCKETGIDPKELRPDLAEFFSKHARA